MFLLIDVNYYGNLFIIISIILCTICVKKDYKINKKIITLGNIFTSYWFFYTNSFWLNYSLGYNQNIDLDNIYILSIASLIGYISFQIVYLYKKTNKNTFEDFKKLGSNYDIKLLENLLIVILMFAILIEIYFYSKNGFSSYFLISRSDRTLVIGENIFSTLFSELLFIVFLTSLVFLSIEKSRKLKVVLLISLINLIAYQLLIIDRSGFLKIILPLMFFLLINKKITNKAMIILGAILFLFLSYFKSIMNSLIFNTSNPVEDFKFNSEFEVWYGIGSDIMNGLSSNSISYLYGESYINALYNLVIPFNSTEALSIWYVKNFYPEIYLKGGGMAFSSITEAILNLGVVFVPIYFMILGYVCRLIDNKKFDSAFYLMLYSFTFTIIYKFFRSEVYSLVKTSWWFFVLPIILILFIVNRKKVKK